MIHEIDGNLLEQPVQAIIHQANCFNIMGGGTAKFIKQKYPDAYEADVLAGLAGDIKKLGSFSFVYSKDKWIYNLYGQYDWGTKRATNYEAVYTGLEKVNKHIQTLKLKTAGLPKNMGCGLGGGTWSIMKAIIDTVWKDSSVDLYICNYNPDIKKT